MTTNRRRWDTGQKQPVGQKLWAREGEISMAHKTGYKKKMSKYKGLGGQCG